MVASIRKLLSFFKPRGVDDWFRESLPEPYLSWALYNRRNFPSPYSGAEIIDAGTALFCSFSWSESPQGFKFWNHIYNQLDNGQKIIVKPKDLRGFGNYDKRFINWVSSENKCIKNPSKN